MQNTQPKQILGSRSILEARRRQEEICRRKEQLLNRLVSKVQAHHRRKVAETAKLAVLKETIVPAAVEDILAEKIRCTREDVIRYGSDILYADERDYLARIVGKAKAKPLQIRPAPRFLGASATTSASAFLAAPLAAPASVRPSPEIVQASLAAEKHLQFLAERANYLARLERMLGTDQPPLLGAPLEPRTAFTFPGSGREQTRHPDMIKITEDFVDIERRPPSPPRSFSPTAPTPPPPLPPPLPPGSRSPSPTPSFIDNEASSRSSSRASSPVEEKKERKPRHRPIDPSSRTKREEVHLRHRDLMDPSAFQHATVEHVDLRHIEPVEPIFGHVTLGTVNLNYVGCLPPRAFPSSVLPISELRHADTNVPVMPQADSIPVFGRPLVSDRGTIRGHRRQVASICGLFEKPKEVPPPPSRAPGLKGGAPPPRTGFLGITSGVSTPPPPPLPPSQLSPSPHVSHGSTASPPARGQGKVSRFDLSDPPPFWARVDFKQMGGQPNADRFVDFVGPRRGTPGIDLSDSLQQGGFLSGPQLTSNEGQQKGKTVAMPLSSTSRPISLLMTRPLPSIPVVSSGVFPSTSAFWAEQLKAAEQRRKLSERQRDILGRVLPPGSEAVRANLAAVSELFVKEETMARSMVRQQEAMSRGSESEPPLPPPRRTSGVNPNFKVGIVRLPKKVAPQGDPKNTDG